MILSKGMNISGYLVDYLVSEGPMSTVYRVEHRALQSLHACKLVNEQYQEIPSVRTAYVREMQQISEIRNPFLIRITDVLQGKYGIGIVMDWMDGYSLQTHVNRTSGVEPLHAVKWICQALSAVHLLHEKGLMHLEISMQNIFLERVNGGKIAVLMDYGMGRRMQGGKVQPVFHQHAMYYLAPEQINRPQMIGPASDVYSLGCILYELLCGERAIQGDTEYSIMHAIVEGEYIPLDERVSHIPEELVDVVQIAMSVDPLERYASAFDFIAALRDVFSFPLLEEAVSEESMDIVDTGKKRSTNPDSLTSTQEFFTDAQGETWVEDRHSSGEAKWNWKKVSKPSLPQSRLKKFPRLSFGRRKSVIWAIIVLCLFIGVGGALYTGGFGGRNVKISVLNRPEWGHLRVGIDGNEPVSGHQIGGLGIEDLGLGEHNVLLQGGVWSSGVCGHCCWEEVQTFQIPFGWGEFEVLIDLEQRSKITSCPTVEHEYLFADIQAGSFMMGSPSNIKGRGEDELLHKVYLTNSFSLGKFEVTQALYEDVMGDNPSEHRGEILPVENVDWRDAVDFCNRLSGMEGLKPCYTFQGASVIWDAGFSCEGYRLPTEAEWEYAARSGLPLEIDGRELLFAGGGNIGLLGWYERNSQRMTHEVGGKFPTDWGLYDMNGNVSEWVWDVYAPYTGDTKDPKGPPSGSERTIRGGAFVHPDRKVRVFTRDRGYPSLQSGQIGFRVARGIRRTQATN